MRRVKCFFNAPAHKKIRREKRAKKAAALGPRPISKLRPTVYANTKKYGSKVKYGRGFSLAELAEAKLSQAFARSVGIAVDHRRHNRNAETLASNVKRLNDYKDRMILFPVRADHPKKGEIADSSADQVQDAQARYKKDLDDAKKKKKLSKKEKSKMILNKTNGVFKIHNNLESKRTISMRCKPEDLNQVVKNTKVYQKLRHERINKRYAGSREKAARLAAEKETKA